MRKIVCLAIAVLCVSACSTTNVGLKYSPSAPVATAAMTNRSTNPPIVLGTFLDQRKDTTRWLGTIRGGYGNPLKYLESDRPVGELVKAAFAEGLDARGIAVGEKGRNQVTGIVKRLDCNQYVRREAYADIEITVLDNAGQQRFVRTYSASNVEGSLLTLNAGIFASVDDLRLVLEKTLREAVDKALDDSALRAALQI